MAQFQTNTLIIGAGASGLMAGIAASAHHKVIICEKMKKPGLKILASGGERCNVTNTLDYETYMNDFGPQGRFMSHALKLMGNQHLIPFFNSINIETKSRDGFRVFPASHQSQTVLDGLLGELERRGGLIHTECEITDIEKLNDLWILKNKKNETYQCQKLIIATGGLTYPMLGTTGDGYKFAEKLGHKVISQSPGGVPLRTIETWPQKCKADTVGKALLYVDIKKYQKISLVGDIIFTNFGIAGKLTLDLSRKITPLFEKYPTIPMILQLRPQMNQQHWQDLLLHGKKKSPSNTIIDILNHILPASIIIALAETIGIDAQQTISTIENHKIMELVQIYNKTPLTVTASMGYKLAFITTGGVKLKEINPETMESKIVPNLYFCGEVVDLDGPCGGYNLQWAFASGYLAGSHT